MGNIYTAVNTILSSLVGITDANYPGDPAGTNANKQYFLDNIHNYIKDLAKAVSPSRIYRVSPAYSGLGAPFFATPAAAFAAAKADGSSSSNKAIILDEGNGSSYSDNLALDATGCYIIFVGKSLFGNVISGDIAISAGSYMFIGYKITGDIAMTGGAAEFISSMQKAAGTSLAGSSQLVIDNCPHWGYFAVSGNNNTLWVKDIDNIEKNAADSNKSLKLASGMTGGTYVIKDSDAEGSLDDPDNLLTYYNNVAWNISVVRPTL